MKISNSIYHIAAHLLLHADKRFTFDLLTPQNSLRRVGFELPLRKNTRYWLVGPAGNFFYPSLKRVHIIVFAQIKAVRKVCIYVDLGSAPVLDTVIYGGVTFKAFIYFTNGFLDFLVRMILYRKVGISLVCVYLKIVNELWYFCNIRKTWHSPDNLSKCQWKISPRSAFAKINLVCPIFLLGKTLHVN